MLKANKGGSGFCVGDQLTIADLELFELFDIFTRIFPSLPEVYPTLAAHSKRISEVRVPPLRRMQSVVSIHSALRPSSTCEMRE